MGTRLEWATGRREVRPGLQEETRYAFQKSLHPGAALIALAAPLAATLIVLSAAILRT